MERDPQKPAMTSDAPAPTTERRAALFNWWNKRTKQEASQPQSESTQKTPEAQPVRSERTSFGKNIVGLLFGDHAQPEHQQVTPATTPEAQPAPLQTPEQTPQYDRATRMRRLARVIIANVLGQVNLEPTFAQQHGEAKPADTRPLADAAQNLQTAANTLGSTINRARSTPNFTAASPHTSGNFDPQPQPERIAPTVEQDAADRIDRRLRRLEATAEEHHVVSVVALGLGVLAVLLTGTEYFGRKRADRKIRHETSEQFAEQDTAINQQRAEFDELKRERVRDMNRNQRRTYYERLGTFTAQQADRTREANRDLQEVVIAGTPEAANPPVQEGDVYERRVWQSGQPERSVAAPRTREQEPDREPRPFVRVESAEHTEHQPGQQTGSAGTGFFGGGGGGIAVGTGQSDLNPPQRTVDPDSPEARKLEALRKAEQARMQQNAWFYGAALIIAISAFVIVALVIG